MFNCIIMGAAGRDFHDFRTFFSARPEFRVRAFTATQIPFITSRSFPASLAGPDYDEDIPIYDESELAELIGRLQIDFVFFAYSDISHREVMHRASLVQAAGASFVLLGPQQTMLESSSKVVAITATRTGAGKSPLTQWLARSLVEEGVKVATLRHPMPYGKLDEQAVQRFAEPADLDRYNCTIEEREEYEPYVNQGLVIFAGVDYRAILEAAEREADIILWDGGNNDFSFIRPDLSIVVSDALRAGHGLDYYPGETNLRAADILVINKVSGATRQDVARIMDLKAELNPTAAVLQSDLEVSVDDPELLRGRRVLVIEDGPTVTHGGMGYGAGWVAAQKYNVDELVDPAPSATGSIAGTLEKHTHLRRVLPAMGYSRSQREELKKTIEGSDAEVVLNASPADVGTLLDLTLPVVRVYYRFKPLQGVDILERVRQLL
ncbi:MAG: GTPase [Haliea sp.]|jgi:predicted GTPase|nr:GTPase [Haliea sp.]